MRRAVPLAVAVAALLVAPGATADERVITHQEAKSWSPDAVPAKEYAKTRAGDVSFSVFDMRGRQREFGGYSQAPMASTYKVMLMVAYLRRIRNRSISDADDRLLRPMITRSDNDTATRIDEMLGRGPLEELADDAEMKKFSWVDNPWGASRTTPRDQALFMRTLQQYVPNRHWDYARGLLTDVVSSQRWGIGKVPIHGWHLHFKGGWGSRTGWVNHQVVLLSKDGRRIGLAVMTESSPSHEYGEDTLEGVFRILLRDLPS